jgi:hypothetical protein
MIDVRRCRELGLIPPPQAGEGTLEPLTCGDGPQHPLALEASIAA